MLIRISQTQSSPSVRKDRPCRRKPRAFDIRLLRAVRRISILRVSQTILTMLLPRRSQSSRVARQLQQARYSEGHSEKRQKLRLREKFWFKIIQEQNHAVRHQKAAEHSLSLTATA